MDSNRAETAAANIDRFSRILICRLSSFGDCVQTLPVLCALRRHLPGAFIGWAVQRRFAQVIANHNCLDSLIVIDSQPFRMPRTLLRLREQLRELRFGVVIDPQSLTKSAAIGWLSGAGNRIGFSRPQGRELAPWLNTHSIQPRATHVVDRYLELLRPLGIDSPGARFCIPSDVAAVATVAAFVRSTLDGEFAVLNPGAGWDSRLWPIDRYSRVARHLSQRHHLPSVVTWAGEREHRWAKQIVADSDGAALLAPATTLPELTALLRRARLFVGSDTGPLHLAAAVGTACVSLHGTTDARVSGPYGEGHIALQEFCQTGSSGRRRRASNEAMRAISVETVCEACDEILQR